MKNLKDFQQTVWYFNYKGEVESTTYQDFLTEFWNDETTSPRGCENREQVASVLVDEEDESIITYSLNDRDSLEDDFNCNPKGLKLKWGVYSWGSGGRGPSKLVSELFDTEEEAEVRILNGFEYDMQTKSSNRPMPYFEESEIREVFEELILEKINEKIRSRY